MVRILFLILIVVLVIWLIALFRKKTDQQRTSQSREITDNMVRCRQCGVHLPQAESIEEQSEHFCCELHRDQFLDDQRG